MEVSGGNFIGVFGNPLSHILWPFGRRGKWGVLTPDTKFVRTD